MSEYEIGKEYADLSMRVRRLENIVDQLINHQEPNEEPPANDELKR